MTSTWAGSKVVTGYTSGALYNPGDTASHTYVVRAVNGTCHTDSAGSAFTDANLLPGVPVIGTVTVTGPDKLAVSWTAGSPAGATYNIYRSTGACPGGAYALVQSGQASSPWTDTTVVGGNILFLQSHRRGRHGNLRIGQKRLRLGHGLRTQRGGV